PSWSPAAGMRTTARSTTLGPRPMDSRAPRAPMANPSSGLSRTRGTARDTRCRTSRPTGDCRRCLSEQGVEVVEGIPAARARGLVATTAVAEGGGADEPPDHLHRRDVASHQPRRPALARLESPYTRSVAAPTRKQSSCLNHVRIRFELAQIWSTNLVFAG